MIVVDANLLIYAAIPEQAQHAPARIWLDRQLNTLPRVGIPWPSVLAFLRVATNPRIFSRPPTLARAWSQVSTWLALDSVWIPQPTSKHHELLGWTAIDSRICQTAPSSEVRS